MPITSAQFIAKWSRVALTERSSYQQHFLDLCELAEHPKPAESDPTGESFCFERGAAKQGGGDGWADVWKRGCFAIEYKGRRLGYVPRDRNEILARLLDAGKFLFGRIIAKRRLGDWLKIDLRIFLRD